MPLNIIFFGTSSDYSLLPLLRLNDSHRVVAIVESGERGCSKRKITLIDRIGEMFYGLSGSPSLWWFAKRRRLPYFYLCRGNEAELFNFLRGINHDIGVVASFNQLLPAEILRIAPKGMINFHPSLLPKHRGPFVWFWEYYGYEKEGGATVHYLDEGEDTGDIIYQASYPIPMRMPPRLLQLKAIELGCDLLADALSSIEKNNIKRVEQRSSDCPRRARYLVPGEDLFNWQEWNIERTTHFLSGVYPWYRAFNLSHGWAGRFLLRATGFKRCKVENPGYLGMGRRGLYFAHPEGKIALRVVLPRERIVLWLSLAAALLIVLFSRPG
jgi:methionyl-tRNA formyltransferase